MQCKDVPYLPILEFISSFNGDSCFMFEGNFPNSVTKSMPGVPHKVGIAKMKQLIRRGFVQGCACGCSSDFTLTQQGLDQLASQTSSEAVFS